MTPEPVTENDLSGEQKKLFLKAMSALEMRNYGYAITLLQSVLKDCPGFLEGRKMLRAAGVQKSKTEDKKKGGLQLSGGGFSLMKVRGKIKKDPLDAILDIEKRLETEPYGIDVNEALFEAANAAGLPLTAGFALETVREGHPENTKCLHKLGEHLLVQGEVEKAASVFAEIVKRDPSDGEASKKARDCSARASMTKGGWGGGGGFRDMLKDQAESQSLEMQGRTGMTEEQLDAQLVEWGAKYAENPNDLNVVRRIADLYERKEDWESARGYYDWAYSLSASDSSLLRKVEEMADRSREVEIKTLEAEIADGTGDDLEEKQALLDQRKQEQIDQRISESRVRVDRNPTDPQLRFELGKALYEGGYYTEAIPELQRAKSNPSIRIRAMLMLGKCCERKKMYDIAVTHFQGAISELQIMDNTKKDALYSLGLVYDEMGDKVKSLECMKEIYNVDYEYRDVSTRVESSYA